MSEELQALLERIHRDGVEKAESERERIVSDARAEADRIVADARAEGEKIVGDARKQAELLERKGEDALRQAARDTLLSLSERLKDRLRAVVQAALAEDLDAQGFSEALAKWVESELKSDKTTSIEVGVARKDEETLSKHLMSRLGKDLKDRAGIAPLKELDSGFMLKFSGTDMEYDFSDEALTDVLCEFLSPRLAEIVRGTDVS